MLLSLPLYAECDQLYFGLSPQAEFNDTMESCRSLQQELIRKKNYFMLSIMTLAGYDGQPSNVKMALNYAKMIKNDDPIYDQNDTQRLKMFITSIKDTNKIGYCTYNFSSSSKTPACEQAYLSHAYKTLKFVMNKYAIAMQQPALMEALFNDFQDFNTKHITFLLSLNLIDDEERMVAYQEREDLDEFILHYKVFMQSFTPNKEVNIKTFEALDKKLNESYVRLYRLLMLVPNPEASKQALKETERAWLKFRDDYLSVMLLRYKDQETETKIKLTFLTNLTENRLGELESEFVRLKEKI